VLCVLEGLSQAAVAKRLGLKLTSVSGVLARARKRLQTQLRSDRSKSLLALAVAVSSPVMVPAALLSQTCILARSTAGLSLSILSLAASVMEVPMRKLLILTMCALIVTSGLTIRTFFIGSVEGQERPTPHPSITSAQSYNTLVAPDPRQPKQTVGYGSAGNKWEYKTLRCSVGALEAQANALGDDGWELCSASPGSESSHIVCIFKRPKSVKQASVDTTLNGDAALTWTLDGFSHLTGSSAQTASSDYLLFNLKKANASDVAETLKSALKNIVVVIDSRSNSVHIQCPNADANAIKLLIETLDKAAKKDTPSQTPTKR
jgi:hypothetical protein